MQGIRLILTFPKEPGKEGVRGVGRKGRGVVSHLQWDLFLAKYFSIIHVPLFYLFLAQTRHIDSSLLVPEMGALNSYELQVEQINVVLVPVC